MQDGNAVACFPYSKKGKNGVFRVQDKNLDTARSLYRVLQLIAFHELKESSILIELAMWKSRIDVDRARADFRIAIPDPAKRLIMEYCGFVGVLRPTFEGA